MIVSEKEWHRSLYEKLKRKYGQANWRLISKKEDLTLEKIRNYSPKYLFFPHWSYLIPPALYNEFDCVVFHMTDLPYGRGGSPLQNLILRGHKETKLSALKVEAGLDTGPIYLKKDLDLSGSAHEILIRATIIMEQMIEELIAKEIVPVPQTGEIVEFKRRRSEESRLENPKSIDHVYDFIRMLDAPGYPQAFIDIGNFRIEFTNASKEDSGQVTANARIFKK